MGEGRFVQSRPWWEGMANKANIIVGTVVAIAAVAAVVALALPRVTPASTDLRALVHDSDGNVRELPLAQDSETTVATSLGTNVVVVESGAVYVRDADCDNHDCMRQGRIDAPGRQIICLPHELWIEVAAPGDPEGALDLGAVAGATGAAGATSAGSTGAGAGATGAEGIDVVSR